MVLGFLFLATAFVRNFAMEDEPRLAGSVEWRCELPITLCFALTGIGFMAAAAAAVGNRAPSPPRQAAPPAPYPPR